MSRPDGQRDPFASVVGLRRGRADSRAAGREPTDLERARELAPLVGAALSFDDIVASARALRRRAQQLGVEVIHGVFSEGEDADGETALTLLVSVTGELIGVVELDAEGDAQLLRPDRSRWTR
jgi:hypothetical protein